MNKAQLIEAVSKNSTAEPGKAIVEAVLDGLGTVATTALKAGDEVTLPGIGKLSVTQRAARDGRNPATGEAIKIAARKAPKFSAAKALKDAVNAPAKKGKK